MSDKMVELLDKVATQLGMTAATLWPELVRYTVVEALTGLFGWTLIMLVSGVLMYRVRCGLWFTEHGDPTAKAVVWTLCTAAAFCALVGMLNALRDLLAPIGATVKALGLR